MTSGLLSTVKGPVSAALLFQGVSLAVGVASVPILLKFLNHNDFLAWMLFATIGSMTIQVEQGILIVAARRLAKFWQASAGAAYLCELGIVVRTFSKFSLIVLFSLLVAGFPYFGFFSEISPSHHWPYAWTLFACAYFVNYYFGYNNAILLSTKDTSVFNLINAATRTLNFSLTVLFLSLGLSILGIALSFFVSVCTSVALLRRRAKHQLLLIENHEETLGELSEGATHARMTRTYVGYTVSAFLIYKGAFLFLPLVANAGGLASYGLALQLVAIIYAISIIPNQVWLGRLVAAVLERRRNQLIHTLFSCLLFACVVFSVSFLALFLFGNSILAFFDSQVALPEPFVLTLIFVCFMVESIIFTLVSFLIMMENKRILIQYIFTTASALIASVVVCTLNEKYSAVLVFLLLPLFSQFLITLPSAVFSVAKEVRQLD